MFEQFKGESSIDHVSREIDKYRKRKIALTASIKYENKRFFTMFVSPFRSINLLPVNNITMMILLFVFFIFVYIIEPRTRRRSTSLT